MQVGVPGGRLNVIAGMIAAVSLCSGAVAQDTPAQSDPVSAMIGTWEFSNADRDKVCRFVFRGESIAGGHKLDIDKNCPNLFPTTRDIVAWAVDKFGSLRLLDVSGNAPIELSEAEVGLYDGFEPGQGRYVLQIVVAAPARSAEEVAGDWAVARGAGKTICVLTLANAPSGTDALALKIKPGCDAFVSRFAPASWRIDQGELLLLSARGQTWRFEANDANTWQRVPDTADPVLLVRQQ
jgi:hypothetical protein